MGSIHARIHLLLDDAMRKTDFEQVLYKFIPLTNAEEVDLFYMKDFLRGESAAEYIKNLPAKDRAIYMGKDRWPNMSLQDISESAHWKETSARMLFFIDADKKAASNLPPGVFPLHELWKKYAQMTQSDYLGHFSTHFLDHTKIPLKDWKSTNPTCVHESGKVLRARNTPPWIFSSDSVRLNFTRQMQTQFVGRTVCINAPYASKIFEFDIDRTDVALSSLGARFSFWGDAQPLDIDIAATQHISQPLFLEIQPQVNKKPVEFFFQGERIQCEENNCRKKKVQYLVPQMRELTQTIRLAVRGENDAYFRGTLRLLSGDIEVARLQVRILPHSWVEEAALALKNPSEYRRFFLLLFASLVVFILLMILLVPIAKKLHSRWQRKSEEMIPTYANAVTQFKPHDRFLITASKNPFACILQGFGAVVEILIEEDKVVITHGLRKRHEAPHRNFCYQLEDGYVLDFRFDGECNRLYCYKLSGRGLSETSARRAQNPDSPRLSA